MSVSQQIFNNGKPVINRKIITVAICSTDRIVYDPIKEYKDIEAKLDNNGRLIVFPPKYPQGLHPGVYKGLFPVLRPSDFK